MSLLFLPPHLRDELTRHNSGTFYGAQWAADYPEALERIVFDGTFGHELVSATAIIKSWDDTGFLADELSDHWLWRPSGQSRACPGRLVLSVQLVVPFQLARQRLRLKST